MPVLFRIASLCAAAAMMASPANAQTQPADRFTDTPALDSYIATTFGSAFKASGPVRLLAQGGTGTVDRLGMRMAVITVPVTYARTAILDTDLTVRTAADDAVTLAKGTVLYHAVFRRYATDADPIEVWCGSYRFQYGLLKSTGYNVACIGRRPDGKGALYIAPDMFDYYDRAGDHRAAYTAPRPWTSHLSDTAGAPFEFPAMTEGPAPSPAMTLSLQVYLPPKRQPDFQVAAVWVLDQADSPPSAGQFLLMAPSLSQGAGVEAGLGDQSLTFAYDPDIRTVNGTAVTPDALAAGDTATAPVDYDGDYYVFFGAPRPQASIADAPWRFGAMIARPEDVTFSNHTLARGDTLMSAKVRLAARYRVAAAPPRMLGISAFDPGDYVYDYEETDYTPGGTPFRHHAWCGVGLLKGIFASQHQGLCIPATPQSRLGSDGLKAWETDAFLNDRAIIGFSRMTLEPAPDPAPATETFEMRVHDIGKTTVEIRAGLVRNGNFLGVRSYTLDFDSQGVAKLYLWSKLVTLQRKDNGLIPTISVSDLNAGPSFGARIWDHNP